MNDDDYAGIVVTNDGSWYRLGRDGFPIESPPDENGDDQRPPEPPPLGRAGHKR